TRALRRDAAGAGGHHARAAHDLRAGRARPVRRLMRTAFLDRDGTINVKAPEGEYVTSWAEFSFLRGAVEAIELLRERGWRVVVVTNQRGVALGRMSLADVEDIHDRMREAAPLDAVYLCPHERDSCDCRKPNTGMFLQAQAEFPDIRFEECVV